MDTRTTVLPFCAVSADAAFAAQPVIKGKQAKTTAMNATNKRRGNGMRQELTAVEASIANPPNQNQFNLGKSAYNLLFVPFVYDNTRHAPSGKPRGKVESSYESFFRGLDEKAENMEFHNDELQRIVKMMPGALAIYQLHDGEFRMRYWSDALPKMLGFSPDTYGTRVAGNNMGLVAEEDRAYVEETINRALQSKEDVDCSYRATYSGGYRWMRVRGRLVGTLEGYPLFVAQFLDTTEEHETQVSLHQAQKELTEIVDNIPSGIGIFDLCGDKLSPEYLNDGYYRMLGTHRENRTTFAGGQVTNAIFPEDLPALLQEAHDSIREQRVFRHQLRVLAGDGTWHWVSISANHQARGAQTERFYAAYYDVNEMVNTKNQLHESKLRLERVLDNTPVAIGVYREKDGIITVDQVNKGASHVSGKPGDTLDEADVQALLEKYVHPNDLDVAEKGFKELLSSEKETTFTFRNLVVETGNWRWVQCRGRSFPQDDGSELAFIAFADVSESAEARQQAERKLSDEKLRMKSLQGGILAASCFNVTQDRNIDINNDENLHYEPIEDQKVVEGAVSADPRVAAQRPETKEILLAAAEQIPDPEQRKRFVRICSHAGMEDAYKRGEHEIVMEYRRNTGKGLIWVSTRIEMLTDPDSGDVLAFYYTSDINEQKIEQLIDQQIISNNYDFIGFMDVGKRSCRLLSANRLAKPPVALDVAADPDFVFEKHLGPVLEVDEADEALQDLTFAHMQDMLEDKPEYLRSITVHDASGKRYRKQLRFAYLDESHDFIYFTSADVTEATLLEQEQRERLKAALRAAEAANAAKTDFLSRMSHDIRTPLNGVIGMTGLALDEQDPVIVREYLNKIDESGKFLLNLVNDILDVAKVESGTIKLYPERYTYGEFQRYIQSIIQPICDEKGVQFTITCSFTNFVVLVDKLRFNQVFFNLLSNAVKFTPRGGRIELELTNHRVINGKLGMDVIVRDTGIGMSEEFQKHLFEPFAQEHTAINDARSGTGLGLAIVKQFVELMGGSISIQSAPHKGTAVTVSLALDIAPDQHEDDVVAPVDHVSLAGKRILVAEDNAINAEIAARLLEKRDATVCVATDGEKAVEQFSASEPHAFDLVLMDVRMPVMDGLEATRRIRALKRPDAKTVPVVAMTANAFYEDVQACHEAGMNEHLPKPFEPAMLYQTLDRLLGEAALEG